MEEEWRIIDEFPKYSVSNKGRIKNNKQGNILIGGYDRDGYRQVTLSVEEKQYNRRICRLVAKAFIPNPNNYPVVNHKDECKDNDNVNNLEWCTVQYNNNYGKRFFVRKIPVRCIETNMIYVSQREASKAMGNINNSSGISRACKNPYYTCHGFHWEYA